MAAARRRGGVPARPAEPASGDRVGVPLDRPPDRGARQPTGRAPCVVHGDFRIGNMLYDEHGLTSILDWEGVHVGEPEEDLAWLCTRVWRFGSNERRPAASRARGAGCARTRTRAGAPIDRAARRGVGGAAEHPLVPDHDDAGARAPRRPHEQPRAGGDRHGARRRRSSRCCASPACGSGCACRIGRRPSSCSMRSATSCATARRTRATAGSASSSRSRRTRIGIISRELRDGGRLHARRSGAGSTALLGDEPAARRTALRLHARLEERNAELAERIRRGEFDGDAEDALLPHLWETVVNKVRIASPNEEP